MKRILVLLLAILLCLPAFVACEGVPGEPGAQGIQGEKGEKGDQGEPGAQGIQGETGNGIESIEKTATDGLTDTYTITMTDGTTMSFTVTNGENGDDIKYEIVTLVEKMLDGYVQMSESRNMMSLTFENARISRQSGEFQKLAGGKNYAASPEYLEVIGGENYTLSWKERQAPSYMYVFLYDQNQNLIDYVEKQTNSTTFLTVKMPDNCQYIRVFFYWSGDVLWEELLLENFQIEYGTVATEYIDPMQIDNSVIDLSNHPYLKDVVESKLEIDYEAYGLPVLYLKGSVSQMNKNNAVTLDYRYGNMEGTCTLKWQGASSIRYPKKNYTIKFDTKFEAKEGWGEEKKYCLKANYIDFSHSRNICSAKLWGDVVESREGADERLLSLINGGAIDGFPICVVINGVYQGIYTFNIPKDKWMFGMGNEASTEKMAIMNADAGDATGLQICTFKSANATGTDADIEIEYVTDEDNSQWAINSINRLIQACIDCNSEADFDANVAPYLDVESAIDYYVFCLISRNFDGISKNYLLVTYDGTKWFFSAYDMDSTFGLWWDGAKFTKVDGYGVDHFANQHRVFELIKLYKADELKARYKELVNGALSEETVIETFTNFIGSIPKALLDEEVKIWPTLPSTSVNNVTQIIDFYRRRRAYIDPQIEALG